MTLRELAVDWIEKHPKGAIIELADLQAHFQEEFPEYCDPDVLTPDKKEPKWRKDIRWALQDCKSRKTIEHYGTDKSGKWKRI